MAILNGSNMYTGMGGMQNANGSSEGMAGFGSSIPRDTRMDYKPKKGQLGNYMVNADGTIAAKLDGQDFMLNGITLDPNRIKGAIGGKAQIGQLKLDNQGNLIGQVSYSVPNPNYSQYGGFGWNQPRQEPTITKSEWMQLSGFQADMANATRSRSGNLPDQNNVYLTPEGEGFLAEIQARWDDGNPFTAAYARQKTNPALQPAGERLSASRGTSRKTATLGGAPSSKADGNTRADEINLRNRKGTLLT